MQAAELLSGELTSFETWYRTSHSAICTDCGGLSLIRNSCVKVIIHMSLVDAANHMRYCVMPIFFRSEYRSDLYI